MSITELRISNFRGIREMRITGLRPITVITGGSGCGKSAVLDALQVHAARGNPEAIRWVLQRDDDVVMDLGERETLPDWEALFHRRNAGQDIVIDTGEPGMEMAISPSDGEMEGTDLEISMGGRKIRVSLDMRPDFRFAMMPAEMRSGFSAIPCVRAGPGMPENSWIARMHDHLSLTDGEDRAVEAISKAIHPPVVQVGCIGSGKLRRPLVRQAGREEPASLRSLGTAALQAVSIALGLGNARGGMLLLDEADSAMEAGDKEQFWDAAITRAVLEDTQILAVTNRTSTIQALNRAAGNFPGDNISRVRINLDGGTETADQDALGRAVRNRTEVR